MEKKSTLFLIFAFIFGAFFSAKATHIMGADITYENIGGNQYRIKLALYRDCSGMTLGTIASISLSSSCTTTTNISLARTSFSEASPLCAAELPNSTCSGGTLQGVEVHNYEAIVTLAACADWTMSYSTCCRNAAITNSTSPGSASIYVEATLNSVAAPGNSSPVFNTPPVPYICSGVSFSYAQGATDINGDGLVYTLVDPRQSATTTVAYNTGFSNTSPVSTVAGVNFNTSTGQMEFTPNGAQIGIVAVLVEEFRGGVLVGSTMRDMQVVILACATTNTPPEVNTVSNVSGGTFDNTQNSFTVCDASSTLSFDITINDNQATDAIIIANNITTALPGATVSSSGTNPVTLSVNWPIPTTPLANYSFNLFMEDDACPIKGTGSEGYVIEIADLDLTITPSATTYCSGDPSVVLNAQLLANGNPVSMTSTGCTNFNQSQTLNSPTSGSVISITGVPTTATGDATITITAQGDLDGLLGGTNEEAWTILGDDGSFLTTVGGLAGSGDQCNNVLTATVTVPNATLAAWIADGTLNFTANDNAGNINSICANEFITVEVDYCGGGSGSGGGGGTTGPCTAFNQNQTITPSSASNSINFTGVPTTATGDATITITAQGDLDGLLGGSNEEAWTILGDDGTVLTTIGGTGVAGDQCGSVLTVTVTVPNATLAAWIADGTLNFTANDNAGNISNTLCTPHFVSIDVDYCGGSGGGGGTTTPCTAFNQTQSTDPTGSPTTLTFTGVPTTATGDATITFTAQGDLDLSTEIWEIAGDDGVVLTTIGASGTQCNTLLTVTVTVPNATLANWISDGTINFTFTDINGTINTGTLCSNELISAEVDYCGGGSGTGTGTGTGTGSGGATFAWTPTTAMTNTTTMSPTVAPTSSTAYTLTANYGGCTVSETVNIVCTLLDTDCEDVSTLAQEESILVNWTVNEGKETDVYLVQRATNDMDFETVGMIPATNPENQASYTFEDNANLEHNVQYYYRIVESDIYAVETSICRTVATQLKGAVVEQLVVAPNPTDGILNLSLETGSAQQFELEMLTVLGQKVNLTQSWSLSTGLNKKQLDLSSLETGIYILSVRNLTTGTVQTRKIIKE